MRRCGTETVHCCWFDGKPCQFVEPATRDAYVWQCALRVKYPSWEEVHQSPEYLSEVKDKMVGLGYDIDCGDWPPAGVDCNDCGEQG